MSQHECRCRRYFPLTKLLGRIWVIVRLGNEEPCRANYSSKSVSTRYWRFIGSSYFPPKVNGRLWRSCPWWLAVLTRNSTRVSICGKVLASGESWESRSKKLQKNREDLAPFARASPRSREAERDAIRFRRSRVLGNDAPLSRPEPNVLADRFLRSNPTEEFVV